MCERVRVRRRGNVSPLQVVKWFTKCLFYSWLLKICSGLSSPLPFLLFTSCFPQTLFNLRPCGPRLSPRASSLASGRSHLRLEAETGAQHQGPTFFLPPCPPLLLSSSASWDERFRRASLITWTTRALYYRDGAAAEDGCGGGWSHRPFVALLLSHHV